jgi:Na+-transporting methylmalonyl-CoA/oxaloacetate decarboxylase gamma subunit
MITLRGGTMLQGVAVGLIFIIILIAILEISKYFRWINNSLKEINEIKKKVNNIEESLKNQNK